jgi:hypothetical protein
MSVVLTLAVLKLVRCEHMVRSAVGQRRTSFAANGEYDVSKPRETSMNRPLENRAPLKNRAVYSAALAAWLICAVGQVRADDAPTPTKHQMMKACMAKQKASDGGMPKEQMKKNCRDVTKTERENAKAEKDAAAQSAESPSKVDHP